jgi:hypothetical protein
MAHNFLSDWTVEEKKNLSFLKVPNDLKKQSDLLES